MKKTTLVILTLFVHVMLQAQTGLLQSGPMLGYVEMREALLWVQTNAPAEVIFVVTDAESNKEVFRNMPVLTREQNAFTAHVPVTGLEPGIAYNYKLLINGEEVPRPYPLEFTTQELWQWRHDPPAVKIALGSCLYINEDAYDRPGRPYGGFYEILTRIHEDDPDMMLWLGDNIYLREVDWMSRSGILARNTHTRSIPELQPLLASTINIAIWDDHDFGPNNSDRSFVHKGKTLEAFKLFWGNPTYGFEDTPGIFTHYQLADAEFFLLDNRYYRSPNYRTTGERTILGERQKEWLIDALTTSMAPFKFVTIGGQVLNPIPGSENYSRYAEEREELLHLIAQERIPGVIFLTGDRHMTELAMLKRYGTYPLYELTVSPLTSGFYEQGKDEANFLRVDGTFVGDRNYGLLEISGPRKDRKLKITVKTWDGKTAWEKVIRASDLR